MIETYEPLRWTCFKRRPDPRKSKPPVPTHKGRHLWLTLITLVVVGTWLALPQQGTSATEPSTRSRFVARVQVAPIIPPTDAPPLPEGAVEEPTDLSTLSEQKSLLLESLEDQIVALQEALPGIDDHAERTALRNQLDGTIRIKWEVATLDVTSPAAWEDLSRRLNNPDSTTP